MRPVTLIQWLNLVTSDWDVFAETSTLIKSKAKKGVCLKFREGSNISYNL